MYERMNIVGCGKLGRTLARLWTDHSTLTIQGVLNRTPEHTSTALAFIGAGGIFDRDGRGRGGHPGIDQPGRDGWQRPAGHIGADRPASRGQGRPVMPRYAPVAAMARDEMQ